MKYAILFLKKLLRYLLKPLSFLPALMMMYLIFSFSSQDGASSAQLSRKVSHKLVVVADEVLEKDWSSAQIGYYTENIHYYVRKTAHVTEYFLLSAAVAIPLYVYGVRGLWLVFVAGIFCVSFAGLDEYHQSFVDARTPAVKDVGIDSMGAFIGILLVQAFCWSVLNNPNKKKKKRSR